MKTTQLIPSTDHVQNGATWIGGPTHNLQRQHVPGYMGHIRGLKAESQHGRTFARVSAECLESRVQRDLIQDKDEKFTTNYRIEFNEPNLRKPQLKTAGERLLEQAGNQERIINQTMQQKYDSAPKSIEDIPPIDRLPVVGYQGFRPIFRPPLRQVITPQKPEIFVHPLNTIEQQQAKQLLDTNKEFRQQFESVEPPIVGYTGFLKGIKAENIYGQTFRDISTQIVQK